MANIRFLALAASLFALALPSLATTPLHLSTSQHMRPATSHLTTTAQKIQWVNCTEHAPEPLAQENITVPTTLPATLHCGLLTVPMNYAAPISSSNNITLGFAMRRPKNPRGLLNYNPGGPNIEVASYAWAFALNTSAEMIFSGLEDFDFLAMDTRGTFQSNPLNCSFDNIASPSYIPSTKEEFISYQGLLSTYAQSCIDGSTPAGIVEFISSAETIQDWNSVRAALGYEKMSYYGVSYGTFSGALYASKYPQHAENFVIDAILAPSISNVDYVIYQLKAVNRLLLRSDAYCMNDTSCPFHAQGKGAIPAAFAAVLSQAAAGNTSNITVTPSDVRAMITSDYLPLNSNFPGLNTALYNALNGDWSGLQWADAYGPEDIQGVFIGVTTMCADFHLDNNTWEGYQALTKAAFSVDTAKIEYSLGLSIFALCGGWPYHGHSNVPIVQDVPMLLVTSDFDLNTPTESATLEFKLSGKSTLVVRHGDDHGTIGVPGAARDIAIEYIRTGVFPKARNETFVTVYEPGSVRAKISNPYEVPVGPAAGNIY